MIFALIFHTILFCLGAGGSIGSFGPMETLSKKCPGMRAATEITYDGIATGAHGVIPEKKKRKKSRDRILSER